MKVRDGFVFSVQYDTAFLVSVKNHFGRNEKNDLLRDLACGSGTFNLEKWLFKTKNNELKKLNEIPYYASLLKEKTEFKHFIGVAVSPFFSPTVDFNHPLLIPVERNIHHNNFLNSSLGFFFLISIFIFIHLLFNFSFFNLIFILVNTTGPLISKFLMKSLKK
jgi:hypothetical protein